MTSSLNTTKLSRRSILGLAVASTAGAVGVTMAGPMEDPLEYHIREAAKLLRARNPAFGEWDISRFNGRRGRMQAVTLMAWRADP